MEMRPTSILCLAVLSTVLGSAIIASEASENDSGDSFSPADLHAFTEVEPIDTHAHVFNDDPGFVRFLQRLHVHLLNIVVANKDETAFPDLESKIAAAKTFVIGSQGQAVLCTTFDPFRFAYPTFVHDAVRQMDRDFAQGAVAVKIWKNVGMELQDRSGRFVMPDDPRLDAIYQDIATHGKTLIAHLAEPDSCWQPPNAKSPDYSYYNEHPEWYMFKHPDLPQKATIIQARDHMLEKNPRLRVVGAHLGSLEMDLDELGRTFEKYSNFAVDVAARTVYLTLQPRDKARQFIIKYQDRILYGTDLGLNTNQNAGTAETSWNSQYAKDWAFFSSNKTVSYRGRQVQGLGLPSQVLHKLYHDNAVRWIQGVVAQSNR